MPNQHRLHDHDHRRLYDNGHREQYHEHHQAAHYDHQHASQHDHDNDVQATAQALLILLTVLLEAVQVELPLRSLDKARRKCRIQHQA